MWVRANPTDRPSLKSTGYGPMNRYHFSMSIRSVENVVVGPLNQCWSEYDSKVQDYPKQR